jgi:hypothetical protein
MSDKDILIELRSSNLRGTEEVAISIENINKISEQALNNALDSINSMADKVQKRISEIHENNKPSEIEIEFGLKLTTDANAFIVNAGAESQLNVTLKWVNKKKLD